MALLRLKYGAKPRNLELFYDRCFFSCLFAGEQSIQRAASFFSFLRQAFTYLGFHYRSQLTVTWTPTSFWPLLEQQSEHEPLKQTQESGKEAANETYSPHEETYDKQDCQS